jgi:hypothetical protein
MDSQADFFCGTLKGISSPYSWGRDLRAAVCNVRPRAATLRPAAQAVVIADFRSLDAKVEPFRSHLSLFKSILGSHRSFDFKVSSQPTSSMWRSTEAR